MSKSVLLLASAGVLAAAATPAMAAFEEEVQELYIAYYGRPADPDGQNYWGTRLDNAGGSLEGIVDAFGNSQEFTDRYGELTNEQLIDALYQQAFGRDADDAGKAFYLELLDSGAKTLASIALDILNGAQNEDLTIVENKRQVAMFHTQTMDALCSPYDLGAAVELIDDVDATTASVDTAQEASFAALQASAEPLCFAAVQAPETDAEKRGILASDQVIIDGNAYAIGYNTILRSGESAGTGTFGLIYNQAGEVITFEDGSQKLSDDNDFSSLIPHGDKLFMISGFESKPGGTYVTELAQDPLTGALSPLSTKPVDTSAWGGQWMHCAGSVTPWNTHLGSEEYEPDARGWDPATGELEDDWAWAPQMDYFADPTEATPYNFGFLIEVAVTGEDMGGGTFAENVAFQKHYAAGRIAVELGYVMPDEKTVYISDDGTNVGLFMFKADNAGDLSSGTLYGAKWVQTSAENGGAANLEWIDLGHATSDAVKELIDSRITFDQIFDAVDPNEDGTCAAGYTSVNTTWGQECLMVKEGMELAASRLETRRYAAMLGVTTEFRKMEGITRNPETNTLYVAMSEVSRGMEDFMKYGSPSTSYDQGGPNDVKLPFNSCGVVYALDLDEQYTATNMYGLVAGRPTQAYDEASSIPPYAEDGPFANNKCDLDAIANPDNITYIPGYDTLIIGEDTGGGHQNDAIWSYNLNTERLTRIQTTPYGSETTSPYFYPNIGGFAYLMSVVQHPFGESDEDELQTEDEGRAYTGYMGAMPALD